MFRLRFGLCALACLVGTLGCVTTKIIDAKVSIKRNADGSATAISSSYREGFAREGAHARAEEFCFVDGKQNFVVVKTESQNQGAMADKPHAKSLDDYRVTLDFKCEGKYSGTGAPFARTLELNRSTASW